MYVRMFWGRLKMGTWNEYESHYKQNIVPAHKKMKGFKGIQLLRSLDNQDEGISITLWDSKENSDAYAKSPTRDRLAKEADKLYTGDYWVKQFEVKISE